MAALTASRDAQRGDGVLLSYPVKASTKIYKGAGVCVDATGYAIPAADTAGLKFVGVSYELVDNSAGASGALAIRVYKTGAFTVNKASAAITDVGTKFYWSDDNDVAASTTNSIPAGFAVEAPSTSTLRIRIDPLVQ